MSHSFEVTKFLGNTFRVTGIDEDGTEGAAVLHSESWSAVLRSRRQAAAQEAFDITVRDFFKPITDAVDAAKGPDVTDWSTVTIIEDSPGIKGQGIELDDNGVLLNILDQERGDLLRWIDDHTLGAIEE